jgi:ribosomal protein L29
MDNEILKLNAVELRQRVLDLKRRLVEMRFDKATGKLVDTSLPAKVKKELARVLGRLSQVSAG